MPSILVSRNGAGMEQRAEYWYIWLWQNVEVFSGIKMRLIMRRWGEEVVGDLRRMKIHKILQSYSHVEENADKNYIYSNIHMDILYHAYNFKVISNIWKRSLILFCCCCWTGCSIKCVFSELSVKGNGSSK